MGARDAALAFALSAAPAWAGDALMPTISPHALEWILEREGVPMEIAVTGGDATLRTRNVESGAAEQPALPFEVFFYECDGGEFTDPARPDSACLSFEFRALAPRAYSGEELERANRWNDVYHFGKAWRDEFGDLSLQMSVVVDGGVTENNIRASYRRWKVTLAAFSEYLQAEQP